MTAAQNAHPASPRPETGSAADAHRPFAARRYLTLCAVLLLSIALILFTQQVKLWFSPEATPIVPATLAGLAALWLFSLAGIVVSDLIGLTRIPVLRDFPILGWVALVSLFSCLAWDGFVTAISAVDFLSLTTPILAFAGVSVADRLIDLTKTSWKVALTAVFVFIGTYVGSATLAQIGLTVSGS